MNEIYKFEVKSKTNGKFNIIIDKEDYNKIKDFNWYIHKDGNNFYARTSIRKNGKQDKIRMHRMVMGYPPNNRVIDHINNNGLDNRKSNLRICTRAENLRNSKKYRKDTSSKYKGVCFHKATNKFISKISFNENVIYLGCYDTEFDAALVYNGAAKCLFGEFANLNKAGES